MFFLLKLFLDYISYHRREKLQEDASDGHQAKLEAQNRFLKDRLGQVESLVEENAIYKAENINLHKQMNYLRQKIVTFRLLETELHQTKELLRRRETEVNDCEIMINKCMIKIDRQDMEIKIGVKRMQELCKMQQDLQMLHDHVRITYDDDDQCANIQEEPERVYELGCEKETVEHDKIEEVSVKIENSSTSNILKEEQETQQNNINALSVTKSYEDQLNTCQKKIQSLEEQLETCQTTIESLNESLERTAGEVRGTTDSPSNLRSPVSEDINVHHDCLLEISSLKEEVKVCKQCKDDVERMLNDQNNELLSIKNQNTQLEEQTNNFNKMKDVLEERLKEQERELDIMRTQKAVPVTNIDTVEKLTDLQNENEELLKKVEALKSELEKQSTNSSDATKALENQLEHLQAENESFQDQLKQVISEKDYLQKQVNEIGAVTEDLEQTRNKNTVFEKQRIKELEDEVEQLNLQLINEIQKSNEYEKLTNRAMTEIKSDVEITEDPRTESSVVDVDNDEKEEPSQYQNEFSKSEILRESSSHLLVRNSEENSNEKISCQLQTKSSLEIKDYQSSQSSIKSIEIIEEKKSQQQIQPSVDESKIDNSYMDNRQINLAFRKSYDKELQLMNQRFDTKIKELQELHDLEKEEVSKKHDTELDTMRLQIEALENELKKIDERCKCGVKKPRSVFITDERLAKICRDLLEFGLEVRLYFEGLCINTLY